MNIGIDIDDTLSESIEATDYYAKEYTETILKRKFDMKKVKEYNNTWYLEAYGWNQKEDEDFFRLYQYKILQNAKPKKDVQEVIKRISNNNRIIIITAREKELKDITIKWFEDNNITFDDIIFEQKDKIIAAKENHIDLFIDDNYKICKSISENGIKALLMNSRINSKIKLEQIIRVYNWKDIEKIILNMYAKF